MIALGFRRSRRNASDHRPPWLASSEISTDSSSAIDMPSCPPSRIRGLISAVRDVDEQVHEHDDDRDEQDPALDHRVVAVLDRLLQPRPDPGIREHRLGQDRAREQQPDLQADDRRHGQERVPQNVTGVDGARRQPLRARGPDVVLVLHVEHRGARDARDDRQRDRAQRDRGQDQMFSTSQNAPRFPAKSASRR